MCSGATDCSFGTECASDADCDQGGACTAGRCAPEGMAFIPAGIFEMGSRPAELGRVDGEDLHAVRLTRGFFLDRHEVTQGEWEALMGDNPSFFSNCGPRCPVERVTWTDALAFANARSRAEGLEPCYDLSSCTGVPGSGFTCQPPIALDLDCTGYRLPTEAEWEHAYRALTRTAYYNGEVESLLTCDQPRLAEIAHFCGNCSVTYGQTYDCSEGVLRPDQPTDCGPAPVGSYAPNAWGLYDMAGNVAELVWDAYGPYDDYIEDPTGPWPQDGSCVLRGSTFCGHTARLRAADRKHTSWVQREPFIGFRLARTHRPALPEERVGEELCNNGCGGCRALVPAVGTPCGPCGAGQYVCDGPQAARCDPGPTNCDYGSACDMDADCRVGHCSLGHCVPPPFEYIPAGAFPMGSPPNEPNRRPDEDSSDVQITRPYMMLRHEVTRAEWRSLMGYDPSSFPACGDDCPVDAISWLDALVFANALSRTQGLPECYDLSACTGRPGGSLACPFDIPFSASCEGYRLPTEAEWEHAYRAGTHTAFYNGQPSPGMACSQPLLDAIGQYCGNCEVSYEGAYDCSPFGGGTRCGVAPVGSREPNPWGLHDMAGNVAELVWDVYEPYPSFATDPTGPIHEGQPNLARGGTFCGNAGSLRAASRRTLTRITRGVGVGVRIVRSLPPDGTVGTSCDNGCGGCTPIAPRPGLPCGPCAADQYECISPRESACSGATTGCTIGATCTRDADCRAGRCSNGRCSIAGFAYVPAGSFTMGSNPTELVRDADETAHSVTLSRPYLLQEHEVTRREWSGLMGVDPSSFPACGQDCPIDNVTWLDGLAYANALSRSQGLPECYDLSACTGTPGLDLACPLSLDFDPACRGYRLPTEAEWEHAYRAGTTTALYNGEPTSGNSCVQPLLDAIAHFCGNCEVEYDGSFDCSPFGGSAQCGTSPVGRYAPNAWGLYDMSGNVSELVWDVYEPYPPSATDPAGPAHAGQPSITRGGNFCQGLARTRGADRATFTRITRRIGVGLRMARTVP